MQSGVISGLLALVKSGSRPRQSPSNDQEQSREMRIWVSKCPVARPPPLRWSLILVSLVNMARSPYDAILILDKVKHALLSGGIGQCRGIIMYKYWVLRSSVASSRMYR
ncbi:uncharacterized protein TrAFT101_006959 [Trichoderma asperellum]|uniref:uncharacterized protein n=1 Tax=Trichoderma asperellum TaxID=101201 RepID=UPI0033317863|nr:hypothetical protein TrAFT101_006959 [Trichoderma asperellum]